MVNKNNMVTYVLPELQILIAIVIASSDNSPRLLCVISEKHDIKHYLVLVLSCCYPISNVNALEVLMFR